MRIIRQRRQTDRQTPGTAAERSAGNNNTAASHGREAETGKTGPGKAVGSVCSRVFELELMTLCGLFKGQSSRSRDKNIPLSYMYQRLKNVEFLVLRWSVQP